MEYKFTEVIQRAIVCMNGRILNAKREEDRPNWHGFSDYFGHWFNSISATREKVVGKDETMGVVQRTITFQYDKVVVARITLEGIYNVDRDGRRNSPFVHWDVYLIEYALWYNSRMGATEWTSYQDIPHNGATIEAKAS